MKPLLILSAAALLATASLNAQTKHEEKHEAKKEMRKLRAEEVSYQSKQAFAADFGTTNPISTQKMNDFNEFTFVKDGQTVSAFYDIDAKLVGTTFNKNFSDLPEKAQQYIHEKYVGYTPVNVLMYDDNEVNDRNMILYNTQFEDEDSYFVELEKGNSKIVVHVSMSGEVAYYTKIK